MRFTCVITVLLAACDTEGKLGDGEDAADIPYTHTDDDVDGEDNVEAALQCSSDGEHDFTHGATGLDDHEGLLVWASAVEDGAVSVLMQSVVTDGAFEASCADSLVENFAYPSSAIIIDADNSGNCSPDDLYFEQMLFGWDADVTLELSSPDAFQPIGDTLTWDETPICDLSLIHI